MIGNVSLLNHIIHFILGIISFKYNLITPLFLLYQLFDGYKTNYNLVLIGSVTDDIPLDLLFFSLGALVTRYF